MNKIPSPYHQIYGWLANGEQIQIGGCATSDGYRNVGERETLGYIRAGQLPDLFRLAPKVATFTITCAHDKVGQLKAAMEKLGATLASPAP